MYFRNVTGACSSKRARDFARDFEKNPTKTDGNNFSRFVNRRRYPTFKYLDLQRSPKGKKRLWYVHSMSVTQPYHVLLTGVELTTFLALPLSYRWLVAAGPLKYSYVYQKSILNTSKIWMSMSCICERKVYSKTGESLVFYKLFGHVLRVVS